MEKTIFDFNENPRKSQLKKKISDSYWHKVIKSIKVDWQYSKWSYIGSFIGFVLIYIIIIIPIMVFQKDQVLNASIILLSLSLLLGIIIFVLKYMLPDKRFIYDEE